MTNYLKLFSSVAEQDAFRDGNDYVEPHVSCIEDGSSVKYNKRPLGYDIEIDCNGEYSCSGQEILSMSSNLGPYELIENYSYSVTNPNLTTNPLETIKVKITNTPSADNIEGRIVECTRYENDGNHGWSSEYSDNAWFVTARAYNNDGKWEFQVYLCNGC